MKKMYSLIALAMLGSMAMAQNRHAAPSGNHFTNNLPSNTLPQTLSTPPTDTIWGNIMNWNPTIYNSDNSGYISGNNGYGDRQIVQSFTNTGMATIYGSIMWIGIQTATSGNPTSHVKMRVYDMSGVGNISTGTGSAPGNNPIRSEDVLLTQITPSLNLNTAYIHTFATSVLVTNDFAVGINLQGMFLGDTVALVHSDDGESGTIDQSWSQFSDGTWYTFAEPNNWDIDCDLGIFPIIAYSSNLGLSDIGFISGVKLITYPNPTVNNATISYELKNTVKNVEIKILDATGKVVMQMNEGGQAAGTYNVNLDATTLAAGTYYVTLQAGGGKIATTLVIQ